MKSLNTSHKILSQSTAALSLFLLLACTDPSRKAEKNLQLLQQKALALDSIINAESRKLKSIDSSLNSELIKAGKLDSIINAESLRIDSLVNKVYKDIRRKNKE